ncbi:MAG: hypothetical protein GX610_15125 [Rhodococcus sp.]|nr:hypothetical protein [Rhodococcus sp. (in: high G+C Gram-positive bacteria)]
MKIRNGRILAGMWAAAATISVAVLAVPTANAQDHQEYRCAQYQYEEGHGVACWSAPHAFYQQRIVCVDAPTLWPDQNKYYRFGPMLAVGDTGPYGNGSSAFCDRGDVMIGGVVYYE